MLHTSRDRRKLLRRSQDIAYVLRTGRSYNRCSSLFLCRSRRHLHIHGHIVLFPCFLFRRNFLRNINISSFIRLVNGFFFFFIRFCFIRSIGRSLDSRSGSIGRSTHTAQHGIHIRRRHVHVGHGHIHRHVHVHIHPRKATGKREWHAEWRRKHKGVRHSAVICISSCPSWTVAVRRKIEGSKGKWSSHASCSSCGGHAGGCGAVLLHPLLQHLTLLYRGFH
mmetsp:Transcript_12675/g.19075  ORF Transcript_12675/g.19075 Transcript_12675/m.19075 type:complete len:222 (-) Transcript_12675:1131-1796(-)